MRSVSYSALSPWPDFGINFETAFVARLNETGYANDNGSDDTAVEFIGMGTERGKISNAGAEESERSVECHFHTGRDDHQLHWPLWAAVNYTVNDVGGFTASVLFA